MCLFKSALLLFFITCTSLAFENRPKKVKLVKNHGNFSTPLKPNQPMYIEFVIRAKPGRTVSVRFDLIDLDPRNDDLISIKDGRKSTLHYVYKRKRNGSLRLKIEDELESGSVGKVVEEPVQFDAVTNRLFITYYTSNSKHRTGLKARYETYPKTLCRVSELFTNGNTPSCDGFEIAPVARKCFYEKQCRENYEPKGFAVCRNGRWIDNIECLPNATIVGQCQFNETGITQCPFSPKELARFYSKTNESSSMLTLNSVVISRSSAQTYGCPTAICSHSAGRFSITCRNTFAGNYMLTRVCLLCQMYFCPKPSTYNAFGG